MSAFKYIIERLKEPSSYAGIAALLAFAGLKVTPDAYAAGVEVAASVAAFVAIAFPDRFGAKS